jgi:transcriptional regulator with XRE-family HTH domain
MQFGELLRYYRKDIGYTLREFAESVDYDASNVSKIERGVILAPKGELALRKWARALNLETGSRQEADFIAAGMATTIKRQLKSDSELAKLLPAFCRTLENKRLDPKTYKRLIAVLRQNT